MKTFAIIVIALAAAHFSGINWKSEGARIRTSLSTFGAPKTAGGMGREVEAGLNADPSATLKELDEITKGFTQ